MNIELSILRAATDGYISYNYYKLYKININFRDIDFKCDKTYE